MANSYFRDTHAKAGALTGMSNGDYLLVAGNTAVGDAGRGIFYYDSSSVAVASNSVIVVTAGGRWLRNFAADDPYMAANLGVTTDAAVASSSSAGSHTSLLKKLIAQGEATDPVAVVAYSTLYTVTLSTDTAPYAAGDLLADSQVLTNITRANNSTGVITSLLMIDKADQKVAMTIYFLSANVSMGSENAAPSISDPSSLEIIGMVDIATSDWKDLGGTAVARPSFQPFNIRPATGTRDVYIAAVNGSGTPTFAADSLVARISVYQD